MVRRTRKGAAVPSFSGEENSQLPPVPNGRGEKQASGQPQGKFGRNKDRGRSLAKEI